MSWFMNLGIVRKLILCYIFIIFIPFLILGWLFYSVYHHQALDDYSQGKLQIAEQAKVNLETSLFQIESIYQMIQFNTSVTNLLSGFHTTLQEEVYVLLNDIRPLISYVSISNPQIDQLKIYMIRNSSVSLSPEISPISDLQLDIQEIEQHNGTRGTWHYVDLADGQPPKLYYLKNIYDTDFTSVTGILLIELKDSLLVNFIQSLNLNQSTNVYLMDDEHHILLSEQLFPIGESLLDEHALRAMNDHAFYSSKLGIPVIVNQTLLERLGVHLITFTLVDESLFHQRRLHIIIIAFLLLVLSGLYYLFAASIVNRILKLARHMSQVDDKNLSIYSGHMHRDEVGLLTNAFNRMMKRMDEMINTIHRGEIRQKETDFLALQAQIKPHFIFNTLESIRMLAEVKSENKIAEMAYNLGMLIRYSLVDKEKEIRIRNEIEHVERYLTIYRSRMGERLRTNIRVDESILDYKCPSFILQPMVENAIIHGIGNSRAGGTIQLTGQFILPRTICLTIEDDGEGIPADRLQQIQYALDHPEYRDRIRGKGNGIGLFNVYDRLRSYFQGSVTLQITSELRKGTRIILELYVEKMEVLR